MTPNSLMEYLKFFILLTTKQIITALVVIVIGSQAFINYKLSNKVDKLDGIIINNDNRYNTNINILHNKIAEQEREKFRITEEAQKYFRERVEKLEEESRENYREVKNIKVEK
jgi:hypothetical protein